MMDMLCIAYRGKMISLPGGEPLEIRPPSQDLMILEWDPHQSFSDFQAPTLTVNVVFFSKLICVNDKMRKLTYWESVFWLDTRVHGYSFGKSLCWPNTHNMF